jgi:hypothetical protein
MNLLNRQKTHSRRQRLNCTKANLTQWRTSFHLRHDKAPSSNGSRPVNTKSNKLNAIILLRKHYNLTNDLLRDTREGNFKDIETYRKKSLKTLDDNLIGLC